MVRYFKALADPTRLRIVRLLAANQEESCVCELVDSLEEPQYHVSRHLKELRDAGLLEAERDGRWVYYRLNDTNEIVRELARVVAELPGKPFEPDEARFAERLGLRIDGRCRIGIRISPSTSEPSRERPTDPGPDRSRRAGRGAASHGRRG